MYGLHTAYSVIFIFLHFLHSNACIGFSIIFSPEPSPETAEHSLDSNKQVQDRRGDFGRFHTRSLFSLLPLNVAAENTVENAPPIECMESPIENRA